MDNLEKLNELAALFAPHATLYAVGGFVRDRLLGCEAYDVDVCSKLQAGEVKAILSGSEFAVSDKSLRMGTVRIWSDDFAAEYTAFRTDSYDRSSGAHSPSEVRFTDDISEDARRRDFKCNAVYLDILNDSVVDPIGGVRDIENKILSTADDPNKVFEADGLRILRLVRFASELGFVIEDETKRVAKDNAWRAADISPERIRDELSKIFTADTVRLKLKDAHLRGFRLLDELGLVDLLLPELASLKGLAQKKQYHIYDAYEHSIKAFELSPPHLRWAALLHDIGKRAAFEKNGGENMRGHDEIGAQMADGIFKRLRFSNADRERNVKLILKHMVDIKGDTSPHKLRRFAARNSEIMDDLCVIKDVDAEASCGHKVAMNRLRDAWEEVKGDGTPLSLKDLKVDGNDLLALGAESKNIGDMLKELLDDTILNPALNDRKKALEYVKRKLNKKSDD
ncbi:MAG: HD domain-containing protein [Bacteroides sp.]|nr:HD domain-containing protein [Bacillota bacterium]MCM1393604.1 HD domain-containing protein [[Eubacterium] siraeum]MCM1455816.1 HD domain-containing protein [Bacteroides sp.]